ncbi:hypothetical protein ACCQ05_21200 [Xanthomonas sp. NCPPB 3582]|uniref:hypothetical protein n=1 Tax=Xanthomonas sp. NCPPB 3582 TaxID=487557 RepID=UPI003558013D
MLQETGVPEIWSVNPNKGLGPLEFGMTQAQVAAFEAVMGPLDDTTTETLPDGGLAINEFRDRDAPLCSFQDGRLAYLSIGQSDTIDVRFHRPKGEPPVFVSAKTGFTWPQLVLFSPGREHFKAQDLIEISNQVQ